MISDLDSTNGTFVNNVRLEKNSPRELAENDIIRLSNVIGTVRDMSKRASGNA